MPLLHCAKCHHEWEAAIVKGLEPICDWCGAHGYIIEEKTPLEKMLDGIKKMGGIEKFLKGIKKDANSKIRQ